VSNKNKLRLLMLVMAAFGWLTLACDGRMDAGLNNTQCAYIGGCK